MVSVTQPRLDVEEQAAQPQATMASIGRLEPKGLSAEEYAYKAMAIHQSQYKGATPPALLKWAGDAALAVLPMNRIDCAIGLTTGLMLAGTVAKIATGYSLDGKIVEKAAVPTFLQGMHKIVKNYDPKGLDARNRWIKYAQWAAYSLGGMVGVKIGTDTAYKNVYTKNKDPHYVEEYLSRVSMHQGETWSWLGAFSGMFGSASGLFTAPIPGINYGVSLAARTTSMQDRNFMLKDVNGMLSGGTTPSYLRLKEGTNYLCHYAVGNPAKTPTQVEFLAYTLLGPLFKDQLTAEHIQQFADTVSAVRDSYWEEGGIPKAKRKEALNTMKEVFTGAGLEVLLIDMGLNPGGIAFDKINGLTGKIGNLGVMSKVHAEQEGYIAALKERLPKYVADGQISQARADWVVEGIAAMQQGKPAPAAPQEPARDIAIDPAVAEAPKKEFSDHAKRHRHDQKHEPAERLIKAARKDTGDWREAVTGQKQRRSMAPAVE